MSRAGEPDEIWAHARVVAHSRLLLDAFAHWVGRELIAPRSDPLADARALFHAPFVVVSHGTEADPVLNYGNRLALELWAVDFQTLTRTPSRRTAEPVHRAERARLLAEAGAKGYVAGYGGVRISARGARFRIEDAIIWNLRTANGRPAGQAATFERWHWLS